MSGLELANKQVVVLGMGLTGQSCVRFLLAKGAKVIVMDSREGLSARCDAPVYLGPFDLGMLLKADLIVASPGVDLNTPVIQHVIKQGRRVIGDIELFAQFNTTPVIAITGSNGKTTVTHLVTEMAKQAGKSVYMGGNVGVPALDLLDQDADLIVLELSSFQLDTTYSLHADVATVLNISEDHLDRHGNIENYRQAKLKVFDGASVSVINRDDPLAQPKKSVSALTFGLSARKAGFSWDPEQQAILLDGEEFIQSEQCLLSGAHNMLNVQAAAALAMAADIDATSIKQAAQTFGGLPHRCETVAVHNGVRWINDSKATNVGATLAAVDGLTDNFGGRLILIAGGEGKNADFAPLQSCLTNKVSQLITMGKDGGNIARLVSNSQAVGSLEQAVTCAAQYAEQGDIVLLSPACASLDMYSNYQQRGEHFASVVKELAQ